MHGVRWVPPGRWEVAAGRGPPREALVRSAWCLGSTLAGIEWTLADGQRVWTLVGSRDLDPAGWRHLRTLLRLG